MNQHEANVVCKLLQKAGESKEEWKKEQRKAKKEESVDEGK